MPVPALLTAWSLDLALLLEDPPDDAVVRHGEDLLRRWASPGRHYHTTSHLVEMFWALEELEDAGQVDERDGALARVAAWFHDAVYDPRAPLGQNEAASAELAGSSLQQLGADPADVAAVTGLVRLTDGHDAPTREPLPAAFHDSDLWILAAPEPRFDEYCAPVREEYAHVPDQAYRQGRHAVLEPFQRRGRLYRTGHAHRQWERRARLNLARELDRLSPS